MYFDNFEARNTPQWRDQCKSEVGGLVKPANLDGSCVRDPVAGLHSLISPQGPCVPVPLVLDFVMRNQMKSVSVRSWRIPGGFWMSSGWYS